MANFLPKSDREFRVGHGCCSSSSPDDGERRRRRSDLDGDDIAESSAAARRHSRLLSRWVARQTEDIITTIERRNRESELLALTSLHTVLESSFLRPPPQPPSSAQPTPAPTPISAASSILRRWRELEDEARASGRSASPSSSSSREQSPESGESERVREIIRGMTESARVSPESPRAEWLGETERERVRHVREWVQTATQRRDDERERRRREDSTPPGDALRIRGRQARLDLIMRIVRERQRELQGLQEHRAVSDFAHRNRIQSFLRGRFLRNGRPVEDERSPSVAARELGQLQQRNPVSGLRREGFHYGLENIVHGQASSVLDSSTRTNSSGSRNDQSQLTSTVELSSENHVEYQSRSESSDILQTIQEHATAEFEGTIPNESTDWQESATRENWQEVDTEQGESDWQHPSEIGFSEWQDGTREESEVNWQENIDQEWSRETPEDEEDEESHILEENDEWHENDAHENVENWEGGPSDPPRDQHSVPLRRVGRFILPDDDNVYSIELRELLSRRSVSNLLRSGFRESLDQLIQSYVERQGHTPLDWHLERQLPSPDSPEQDQGLGRGEPHQEHQGVARPPFVLSSPPVPPPQPLWHSGLRHSNWTRQSMHRPEIEWDIINDLRADMAKLQQGMSHMQRMLEACMDMQLELQRAVRQEVSAALNRSTDGKGLGEETSDYGSKWGHVRKGTCCVCCDTHIDALLYRCGHMCTCSKCANELVRGGGKCPLCRAPIVEVIRAYSIL